MSADFVSTSQLQQLEALLIKRRSPLYLVLGFLLVPTLMIGSVCCLYWWDIASRRDRLQSADAVRHAAGRDRGRHDEQAARL